MAKNSTNRSFKGAKETDRVLIAFPQTIEFMPVFFGITKQQALNKFLI